MITTPFYIEKDKVDGVWNLMNRHDVIVIRFVHEEAAKLNRDMLNDAFQDGFAYCIDVTAFEAGVLEARRAMMAHEEAKRGVAELAMAAGTDQPLANTGAGGDTQKASSPLRESFVSKAIAKVKFVFESIKESGNA